MYPTIRAAIEAAHRTAAPPLVWDPASHLLSRLAFGPTPADRKRIEAAGGSTKWALARATSWYDTQVAAGRSRAGYAGVSGLTRQFPFLTLSAAQARARMKRAGNEYGWDAMDQLGRATLALQTYSSAQLYESLVSFFSDHLNVPNHNGDVWINRHGYDRDVIRKHAMGSFTNMLLASAKHPAMLLYLNLAQSTRQHPNENYARELLELHTLGRRYTQKDVTNAARLLTGRTVSRSMTYTYRASAHATGHVKIAGFSHKNATRAGGAAAGDALLRHLAKHPRTAQHLARKLCIRFVSDSPSQGLVDAVAHAYLKNGTKILPMVQTILRTTEFWQSRGAKVRRPSENLVATVRALGTQVKDRPKAMGTLHWMSYTLGHMPLDWPAPNGYPDVAAAWRSAGALLRQWQYNLGFAGTWWDGFAKVHVDGLLRVTPRTSGEAIDLLTQRLTGMTFAAKDRAALQHFLDEPASTPIRYSRIQWYIEPLAALILNGPHHALR